MLVKLTQPGVQPPRCLEPFPAKGLAMLGQNEAVLGQMLKASQRVEVEA